MKTLIRNTLLSLPMTMLSSIATADISQIEKNLSKLNLPQGFKIDVYAEVPNARQMTLGQSTGTVFVGTRGNNLYAVVDKDKDRKADEVRVMLDDLNVGNGVAMYQGNLYVAEQNRITSYPAPGFDLNLPFKQMRTVIYDQLPDKPHHGWRYISFGPDNKLYVTVGAPCNICDVSGFEGTIMRMNPDGSDAEIYARGVRNSVGMDFQPETGALFFTDNNVDMMGDDNPAGELNAAPHAGMHFGFPYYAGGQSRHSDWADKQAPQDVSFPVIEFQAHTANLGMKFYTGNMFPAEYQGDAFIAQHGSWNRTEPVGYQVVRAKFDDNHQIIGYETFIDGWLNNGEAWGRPTDILQLPDGSILISDDYNDAIYRVSYQTEQATIQQPQSVVKSSGATINDLQLPESAITHPDGRIFVTEIGEFGKQGDGKVTVINSKGERSTLVDGLNDPKGIDLWNNTLYVADVDRVLQIDLQGQVTIIADQQTLPGKAVFLNDVEIDGDGNVFVSDSGADDGTDAAIYKITQNHIISQVLGDNTVIKRPNGLLMDGKSVLLVADFGSGDLYRVDLTSDTVTALNSGFGGADGLVRDSNGFLYVSDWQNGKVWQLAEPKATPQLIADQFKAAADISLSADGNALLVPDMKGGQLITLPIR